MRFWYIVLAFTLLNCSLFALTPCQQLLPNDNIANTTFGYSLATQGHWLAVGNNSSIPQSACYVYQKGPQGWELFVKLQPQQPIQNNICYGYAVAIADNFLAVGASNTPLVAATNASVDIYHFNGTVWVLQTTLVSPQQQNPTDCFGSALAFAGNSLIIAAQGDDQNGADAGKAYVYDYDGANWQLTMPLYPQDPQPGANFGFNISAGTNQVLITTISDGSLNYSGAGYIFARQDERWSQQTKLAPNNPVALDTFGWSSAIDNNQAFIGMVGYHNLQGQVSCFNKTQQGWQAGATMQTGYYDEQLGMSIAYKDSILVAGAIGARLPDDTLIGKAYMFKKTNDHWDLCCDLMKANPADGDFFGAQVAINGTQVFVAAPSDATVAHWAGAVYVFDIEQYMPTTQQVNKLKPTITCYPNPFNPRTTISFNLKQPGSTNLTIYNAKGQKVKQLLNSRLAAGSHHVVWNGADSTGVGCASGVYFAKLSSNGRVTTHSMVLVK